MNDSPPKKSIQDLVLEKVRSGKVLRRPRSGFVLRFAASCIVAALLFGVSVFVISFILFSLHESGEQFLIGYGFHGIAVFFTLFPWLSFVFGIVLLFVLEWLLRGFKFGYRIPLLHIFSALFAGSVVLGFLINFTPLHSLLLSHALKDELPFVGSAYSHVLDHHDESGVFRGIVISVNPPSFQINHDDYDHDTDDGSYNVTPNSGAEQALPVVGDRVLVVGKSNGSVITADHVQLLSPLPPR
jgi:hypothetical protein